ncbi:MAG: zf-HC2 domain-containing protein [Clostridia bacterium]|nr:zf-HC2 domain-containing protein [Clostridia bacterium]
MNKLTCKDACLLLSLYIDDILSDEEMTQMREHLETCDNCRNEYALLKGMMDKSANLECPELSSSFADVLHKKLLDEAELIKSGEAEKPKPAFPVRRFRIYPYIAVGAAAVAISVLAFSSLPESDSFITENKNEVIETVTPESWQEILPEESALPLAETEAPVASEPALKAEATADIQTEAEEDTKQEEIDEEAVALIEKETYEIKAEESINNAMTVRGMPMMAADMATEEEILTDASKEETALIEENAQITEGSRGGGSSSAVEKKVKISVVFSFNHDATDQVRELMSGVTAKGSIYEVPVANLSDYIDMLTSMVGYISHRIVEEDYTKKYNLLEENGDVSGRMAQIEEYINYATIIIGG